MYICMCVGVRTLSINQQETDAKTERLSLLLCAHEILLLSLETDCSVFVVLFSTSRKIYGILPQVGLGMLHSTQSSVRH